MMPNSEKQGESDDYSIKVTTSGPQILDAKKSFFLLDKNNPDPKSPRRDFMIGNNKNTSNNLSIKTNLYGNNNLGRGSSSKNLTIPIPNNNLNIEKFDPLRERIDQKITENIKKREGFESLLEDPEINKYIK